MTKVAFEKYPKVPSVKNYPLPDGPLTIQEKLDGAISGIELTPDGDALIVHSRTRALARLTAQEITPLVEDMGSFGELLSYVHARYERIHELMSGRGIAHIYGEWLTRHTLSYPDDMWRKFYAFDLVDRATGRYFNSEEAAESLIACGLKVVRSRRIQPQGSGEAMAMVEAVTADWNAERRIEGVVVKSYLKDKAGELDAWGQRFAYKHVLPEFKEQHAGNPMFPPPASALTVEQRLAAVMPDRSLEKVFQKVVDARGGWKPQHFPMLLGMAWQEFLEEHAVAAFQSHGLPNVNIRALKTEVERRAREFALSQPAGAPA